VQTLEVVSSENIILPPHDSNFAALEVNSPVPSQNFPARYSKYPPAKPGALRCEPLKVRVASAWCPICSVECGIKCRSSPY
jgi:hypothetical protein